MNNAPIECGYLPDNYPSPAQGPGCVDTFAGIARGACGDVYGPGSLHTIGPHPFASLLPDVFDTLNELSKKFHAEARAAGWYSDLKSGLSIERNPGEQMMLMTTEIAEAFEGVRKNKMDDHLPHRKSVEVELADLLIRVFDFAGYHNLDLAGAAREKAAYNKTREDHKIENRRKPDGKKV